MTKGSPLGLPFSFYIATCKLITATHTAALIAPQKLTTES
jgi:hypothetical protein